VPGTKMPMEAYGSLCTHSKEVCLVPSRGREEMREVRCMWPVAAELGEGPIWSASEGAVWFVDIKGRRVHRFHAETGDRQSWAAPDQVSFILPAGEKSFVAGLPGRLARFVPVTGAFEPILNLEGEPPGNRLNDACLDASGCVWFGSMDDNEKDANGALYFWDGIAAPIACEQGFVISNGPAHSPDGKTLYHTDTVNRTIFRYDVATGGFLSGKRALIEIEENAGWPDGTVVDADGCLWIGLYGGSAVRRYSPDGALREVVTLPCSLVTKVALGGSDLRTAFITTARKGLTQAELAAQPLAGGLFAFNVDVPGCDNVATNP